MTVPDPAGPDAAGPDAAEPAAAEPAAAEPDAPAQRRYGTVALALAIPALAASLLVGWVFPLGIAALVCGVLAVRTPQQRAAGIWAIALAAASLLYSTGWLVYAAVQAGWIP